MRDPITIDDPRAAAVFRNLRQRQLMFCLMEKERSLGDLGEACGTALNLLHYHVGRLISLGLAEICGIRNRAGAPVKLYRATAKAFFIPAELAGTPTDPLHDKLREALERSLAGTCKGVLYTHGQAGAHMRLVRDSKPGARTWEIWAELELSDADAVTLAEELKSVLRKYANRRARPRRRYVVHAALAPHQWDDGRTYSSRHRRPPT